MYGRGRWGGDERERKREREKENMGPKPVDNSMLVGNALILGNQRMRLSTPPL